MPRRRSRGGCPIFCMSCWACSLSEGRCRYDHIQVNREPGRSSHANGLYKITCDVQQSIISSISGRLQPLIGIQAYHPAFCTVYGSLKKSHPRHLHPQHNTFYRVTGWISCPPFLPALFPYIGGTDAQSYQTFDISSSVVSTHLFIAWCSSPRQ
ncbi:hypothetical protein BJX62DRAFT_26720 [Aspergillus germanicus]